MWMNKDWWFAIACISWWIFVVVAWGGRVRGSRDAAALVSSERKGWIMRGQTRRSQRRETAMTTKIRAQKRAVRDRVTKDQKKQGRPNPPLLIWSLFSLSSHHSDMSQLRWSGLNSQSAAWFFFADRERGGRRKRRGGQCTYTRHEATVYACFGTFTIFWNDLNVILLKLQEQMKNSWWSE